MVETPIGEGPSSRLATRAFLLLSKFDRFFAIVDFFNSSFLFV
jgi:hypothetical protein